jgi:2'-5' RNA ligase
MHIIDTCFAAQSKLFEKLLSEALQSGSLMGPALMELEQPCSTLVMRPQDELAQILASRIAELASLFPGQIYYGPKNLHLTVSALPDVVPGSILHRHLRRSLASHVGALRPLEMPVGGFGIIGSAIIIKAFDVEGLLARMVKCLVADIEEEGFAMADLADLHSKVFWLTAARLISPPSDELLDYVSKHKEESLGVANFEAIELVATDSLFSEDATKIMEKYSLGDFS